MDVDARAREAAASLRHQVEPALDVEAAGLAVVRGSSRHQHRQRALAGASLVFACVVVFGAMAAVSLRGPGDGGEAWDSGAERSAADQAIVDGMPQSPIDGRDSWRLPVLAQPQSGLEDGDTISLYGRGFERDDYLGVVICAREAEREGAAACELGDASYEFAKVEYATADSQGTVVARLRVRQHITTPATGPVDCASAPERCLVAFGAVDNYDRSGGSYINFADAPPFPTPSFEVAPGGPLTPGQEVIATGASLMPGRMFRVEQCLDDTCTPLSRAFSTPEGTFAAGVTVNSVLYVDGEAIECADRCTLRLGAVGVDGQTGAPFPDPVPLAFGPGEPVAEDELPTPTTGATSGSPEVIPVEPGATSTTVPGTTGVPGTGSTLPPISTEPAGEPTTTTEG